MYGFFNELPLNSFELKLIIVDFDCYTKLGLSSNLN